MIKIKNSTFEKYDYRYIHEMYTDSPRLEPQYYNFVIPVGMGSMSEGKFEFDGQIFYRSDANGGNRPSSWSIMGESEGLK